MDWELLSALRGSWGTYAFVAWFGALWGSFANVCIYRLPPSEEFPNGRSVVYPPSHCFVCKKHVVWYDNVPVLSYLWLRGKCRFCKTQFSARYVLVEALTGLLFALAWWTAVDVGALDEAMPTRMVRFGILAAFSFVMVVVIFIDLDHQLILDKVTYPAIPVFYGLGLLLPGQHWADGLIGAAVGYLFVMIIAESYRLLRGRAGMGYGDAKLLAVIGAWLGYEGVYAGLFGGALLGAVIVLFALGVRRLFMRRPAALAVAQADTASAKPPTPAPSLGAMAVPFGPFIAAAALFYAFVSPHYLISFSLPW
ncbi:MAG: prepilin peptidase [Myxococcales bacterium]|nr:prepilin peptidase [Myxococcales bacterium]